MVLEILTNVMAIVSSPSIRELNQVTLPNYTFPFKLEQNNYIVWKSQIFQAIVSCNMKGFGWCNLTFTGIH